MDINELIVYFERDEENNWRAVLEYDDLLPNKKISKEIFEVITKLLDKAAI